MGVLASSRRRVRSKIGKVFEAPTSGWLPSIADRRGRAPLRSPARQSVLGPVKPLTIVPLRGYARPHYGDHREDRRTFRQ